MEPAKEDLLEREPALDALQAAVTEAAAGHGSIVLMIGEAGIGKTSVIRAFLGTLDQHVRVLHGTCDDLLAPETLGPLRDAARGSRGPLERALAAPRPGQAIFGAIVEELTGATPTVVVVEDVHWADDATLDVLRYTARRLAGLRAVLVLTFRDDAVDAAHPLQHLLGALAGAPVRRLSLPPLSEDAVGMLCTATDRDGAAVYGLTGGNPFYVTEALAAPPDAVPPTITATVLARLCRLSPDCRLALEQISVAPTRVSLELLEELLGGLVDALAEAEEQRIIEVGVDGIAFRHELARRAVERSLPAIRRRALNREMVRALRVRCQQDRGQRGLGQPDLARLVHHAVAAADAATVAEYAPRAGLEAARAGSHRQALAHYEAALRHADLLDARERAQVLDAYAGELSNAHRLADAVAAGREAVARYQELDDPVALGEALLRLSRHVYMAGGMDEAEQAVDHAVQVLTPAGCPQALVQASAYRGAVLALTDRPEDAVTTLERVRHCATDSNRPDLVALCLNYLGVAGADLGQPAAVEHLRGSLVMARKAGLDEHAARAYTILGEILYRLGRYGELAECLDAGLAFTRERGFWPHVYHLEVHRCLLLVRQGAWSAAEDGLRELIGGTEDPGMLYVYSASALGRLLARRGDPDAEQLLTTSWQRAVAQRSLLGLSHAGIALTEWAWLTGRSDRARAVHDVLLPRTQRPGAAPLRGELLRYLIRAGLIRTDSRTDSSTDFAGCPQAYAAGLRGDWRAAADGWGRIGDPYERALELADSGEPEPTLEALRVLDGFDASAVAGLVRRRLHDMGMRRVPRGPQPATRANPAGLTARQIDVLGLIEQRMTNAEIAQRLVLSVRTVEHHVSAILAKLGAQSRAEAASTAEAKSRWPDRRHGWSPPKRRPSITRRTIRMTSRENCAWADG
jgi:DNA-binding CsgD family transcriptional regulator/tetratricopeptide (TPR) repeat protein